MRYSLPFAGLCLLSLGFTATTIACTTGQVAQAAATASAAPLAQQDSTAEKMLAFQRSIGGWPKAVNDVKVDYRRPLSETDLKAARRDAGREDATIDNNATTREITQRQRYDKGADGAASRGPETRRLRLG
ncbi:MAG: hypothetical protein EOO57_13325 [Hymenobacter sp.]|nr:MAG: hypothetical protein EOO57_13325 [Hymenobacter sp.]